MAPWGGGFRKNTGITNKVELPKFGGKKGHPHYVVDTFRCWARSITHHQDYYTDGYLMTRVMKSVTGDAADVYNWVTRSIRGPGGSIDLGVLLAKFREHYCGSLTFREQHNRVENLRQGNREDAVDVLIRVGSAVHSLAKDWSDTISPVKLESLQHDVFLNRVRSDIRHVLAHGRLMPDRMYESVKCFEIYIARGKRLEGNSPYTGQQRAAPSRFPKTTAFALLHWARRLRLVLIKL